MSNEKRRLMLSTTLTNSDLEHIYSGRMVGDWLLRDVIDEFEGPDGWHTVEFSFVNISLDDSEQKFRGHLFTGRAHYKKCGNNDPYGHRGQVWESALLGERQYPW